MPLTTLDVEDLEVPILLEAVARRYGIDLRDYARASIRRRIRNQMRDEKVATVSGLQERLLHDPAAMERFLFAVAENRSTLFRDPAFFRALREVVVPLLKTYPFIRVWHAGCSTGEDVLATAIVLEEEDLADRCRVYATDVSEMALKRAKAGIHPLALMQEWTKNYVAAGGKKSFSDYYTAKGEDVIFRLSLLKNVVFAPHNLASDSSFNEFNLILCRNVTLFYNRTLHDRVHELLYNSLSHFGVLALGVRETLRGSAREMCYESVAPEKIFRRVR
jgi:chemotaxis protein methyltransferase CheR